MKKIVLIAILSMVLINCDNDDDDDGVQVFTPQILTPLVIAQYDRGGFFIQDWNPYNNYFNSVADWNSFLEWSLPYSSTSPSVFDTIDFNTDTVIVCVDYPRPSTGFSIGFNSVIEYEDEIIVSVNYIDSGGVQGTMPTRPFIIAKIPKTDKPIVFE